MTDDSSESTISLDSIMKDPEIGYKQPSSRGYCGDGRCLIVFNFDKMGTSVVSAVVGMFVVAALKRLLMDW